MHHLMSLPRTWAFLEQDTHVNPESQNCLLCWWFHLSKARSPAGGPGRDPGRQRTGLDQGREVGEKMSGQVGGMLRG